MIAESIGMKQAEHWLSKVEFSNLLQVAFSHSVINLTDVLAVGAAWLLLDKYTECKNTTMCSPIVPELEKNLVFE